MMQRNPLLITAIVALIALGVGAGGGILVYNAVVGGSGEPSEEISSPTLDVNAIPTQSVNQLSTQVAELATENAALQASVEAAAAQADALQATLAAAPVMTEMAETAEADEMAETAEATEMAEADETARILYRINPDASRVSFFIEETLRGSRITVEGTTNQVAGDIVVDFTAPASSQVGTIRINARTLATDNEFRNDALRARILQSAQDEYEFIEFVPVELLGLPETVAVGEPLDFQIVGDLTVRGVTRSVTFEVTVTPVSEAQLEGTARTTVLYADFNLSIPSVPGVSDIADEVVLEIAFVADLVE